jgi:aryl-alcohol dehydrogenase-like predicted oxidoreductase
MKKRVLAGTSLELSEIGFGCGRLASVSGPNTANEAARTLMAAYELGITFYDTADIYGQGRSEEILGRTFGSKRHSVVIATKAGYQLGGAVSLGAKLKPVLRPLVKRLGWLRKSVQGAAGRQRQQNFSPEYLMSAIDRSLGRLRTDYIDIFLLHNPDPAVVDAAGWVDALEQAKAQGKIRSYGVSCRAAQDAFACMRIPRVSCVQIPVNLIEREGIGSLLNTAAAANFGVLARQPLASGMLANPPAALRPEDFPWDRVEFEERLAKVRALPNQGDSAATCVQAALGYVSRLNGIGSVILGMSSREHLRCNLLSVAEAATAAGASNQL